MATSSTSTSSSNPRSFRIEDRIWEPFCKKAKEAGISTTHLLKLVVRDFTLNPRIMIGEPELMEVSPEIQQKLNDLGDFAHKAIRKKRKS